MNFVQAQSVVQPIGKPCNGANPRSDLQSKNCRHTCSWGPTSKSRRRGSTAMTWAACTTAPNFHLRDVLQRGSFLCVRVCKRNRRGCFTAIIVPAQSHQAHLPSRWSDRLPRRAVRAGLDTAARQMPAEANQQATDRRILRAQVSARYGWRMTDKTIDLDPPGKSPAFGPSERGGNQNALRLRLGELEARLLARAGSWR
jgi:hypothetical protein